MSSDDSSDGDVASHVQAAQSATRSTSSTRSSASPPQQQGDSSQLAGVHFYIGSPEGGNESGGSTPSHRSGGSPDHHGSDDSDASHGDVHKKKRLASSSDEGDDAPRPVKKTEVSQSQEADVFGDALSSDESDAEKGDTDAVTGVRLYPEEESEGEEEAPAPPLEAEIPYIKADLPSDTVFHVKMPNFLSIHSRPFDAETYKDEENEEESEKTDEEGRHRLKLKVENVMRWRFVQDPETGELKKESNAKIVKWSDGSMSMYIGKEIFEVQSQSMGEYCHCYIRTSSGLIARAAFANKLNFRPHSTESTTHKKMTMNMADRTTKASKVQVLSEVSSVDPTTEQKEKIRREEEAIRARERKEAMAHRRPRMARGYQRAGYSGYGDESGDEESLGYIKKMYTKGGGRYEGPLIGQSESEESDNGESKDAKDVEAASDDSDEEFRRKHQQKKKVVVDDEEDEA